MAEHFNFNVSTNTEVVAERQQQRGKNVNIINDQSAGINVGNRVLEALDPDHQAIWSQLYGGAMLNSALYMLRGTDKQPMSRHFKLPQLFGDDGVLLDDDERRADTFDALRATKIDSEIYEGEAQERSLKESEKMYLGRRLGNTSMLIGIFDTDFYRTESEHDVMTSVLQQVTAMHHATQKLTQRIRGNVNPSLAQLRGESTPLGSHIVQSPTYPLAIKQAFRDALGEVSDPSGY